MGCRIPRLPRRSFLFLFLVRVGSHAADDADGLGCCALGGDGRSFFPAPSAGGRTLPLAPLPCRGPRLPPVSGEGPAGPGPGVPLPYGPDGGALRSLACLWCCLAFRLPPGAPGVACGLSRAAPVALAWGGSLLASRPGLSAARWPVAAGEGGGGGATGLGPLGLPSAASALGAFPRGGGPRGRGLGCWWMETPGSRWQ